MRKKNSKKTSGFKQKGYMSIRTKILFIVFGFFFAVALVFAFYSSSATADNKRFRLESVRHEVELKTGEVNKMTAQIGQAALFSASSAFMTLRYQSRPLGEKMAYKILRNTDVAIGVGFWFEPYRFDPRVRFAGVYAFIDSETGEVEMENFAFVETYDYPKSDWYTEIAYLLQNQGQVVWTRPYVDDSGTFALMVTAGAGIFDEDGNLIALSTVDWKIGEIIEMLTNIKPTYGSFAVLADPEKNLIISNTLTMNSEGQILCELPWDINSDIFVLRGVEYMTFRRIMNNGWLLSIQVPVNEIFSEVEYQVGFFTIVMVILAILMLLCIYYLISILVNKPIKRLVSDVVKLDSENLGKQIQISSKDEIGVLASAFNKMTTKLKSSLEQSAREQAENQRMNTELNIATQIQASVLPCVSSLFSDVKDFEISASMKPAKEVGGDFYDCFYVDPDTFAVIIADVSGKGVPSALFMMVAKTLLKSNAQFGKSPMEVFEHVNDLLCQNNDTSMFVTVFMGYLNIKTGKFTFVNAGHNPPLLRRKENYDYMKIKKGFVLGGIENMSYVQDEITLEADDEVLLYTDGITEALNKENELFGETRLLTVLNENLNLPLSDLTYKIKSEIDKFADGAEQADDITMLALRYNGNEGNLAYERTFSRSKT